MDFYRFQDKARINTTRLVILGGFGLVSIIAALVALLMGMLFWTTGELHVRAAVAIGAPVAAFGVIGAALAKSALIRSGGGPYVAKSLGGRRVDFNTRDAVDRRLTNVVEEIAIASGMPVPAVYILDLEPGINAFAAGWGIDSAAIGVTRGALHELTRRELQGVVAHEFSHIANGDTRIKTRIIAWGFGITAIYALGHILFDQASPRKTRRKTS